MAVRMERVNKPLVAAFAETLRARRRAAGLSQEELAARSDLSVRHVSYLETGDRQPSLTVLLAVSEGLEIGPAELVEDVVRAYRSELRRPESKGSR